MSSFAPLGPPGVTLGAIWLIFMIETKRLRLLVGEPAEFVQK